VQAIDLAELCYNSRAHHTILRELRFSCLSSNRRELAPLCTMGLSLQTSDRTSEVFCRRLSLAAKSRFPTRETDLNGDLVRLCAYCTGRPSISCCRDHSKGRSVSRVTPVPCGSRPSMAALTRSGARNASEIIILIFRVLHPSRFAMVSELAATSVINSLSQRRPRAIEATSVARVSDLIGRTCRGDVPAGKRISRFRVESVFCHRTLRISAARWRLPSTVV
jgi:hypothetical protein